MTHDLVPEPPATPEELRTLVAQKSTHQRLLAYAFRLGAKSDAEDVVQSVLSKGLRRAVDAGTSQRQFLSWMHGEVRNELKSVRRWYKPYDGIPIEESRDPALAQLQPDEEANDTRWKLNLALACVGEPDVRFVSKELHGEPPKEAAADLGMSRPTFTRRKQYVLKRLESLMTTPPEQLAASVFRSNKSSIGQLRAAVDPRYIRRWDTFIANLREIKNKFAGPSSPGRAEPVVQSWSPFFVEALHDSGVYIGTLDDNAHLLATATIQPKEFAAPLFEWRVKTLRGRPIGLPPIRRFRRMLAMIKPPPRRKSSQVDKSS